MMAAGRLPHQNRSVASSTDHADTSSIDWSKGVGSTNTNCAFAKQNSNKKLVDHNKPDKSVCTII